MRISWKSKLSVFVLVMSGLRGIAQGQTEKPEPPKMAPATSAEQMEEPQAPAPHPTAVVNPFPAVNPKNFTAETPTVAVVNDFLKAVWGSNENRIWSVEAIQKTATQGVARVVVLVADKTQPKSVAQNIFFVMPDGKHAIADTMVDFGAKPFADRRKTLEDRATGPAQGAASKALMLVEFGDLLNAKSKESHETAERLAAEFPQIRLVYENAPPEGRPYAFRAAAEGDCVRKTKGDKAFFTYVQTLYGKLTTLTAANVDATFAGAATEAGADPKAVSACAVTEATKDEVKSSMQLATEVGVEQAPVLVINGHVLPQAAAAGYEGLKGIVAFQAEQDGVVVHVQPTLSAIQ
jgi:protein-disulfide isomerase